MSTRRFAEVVSMRRWIDISQLIILIGWCCSVAAQDIPVGTWRNHVSYHQAQHLAGDENRVFCAVENGLFSISEGEIRLISKIEGLSSPGASAIAYDAASETLLVGHSTGAIDFVRSDGIVTSNSISEITSIAAKTINNIHIFEGIGYIAISFGIAVADIERSEIREFFSEIGPNGQTVDVRDIARFGNQLIATTGIGLLIGDLQRNLLDFNNWHLIPNSPLNAGLYPSVSEVLVYSQNLLQRISGNNDLDTLLTLSDQIQAVAFHDGVRYILTNRALYSQNGDDLPDLSTGATFNSGQDLLVTDQGFFVADQVLGLLQINGNTINSIIPNGPVSDKITHIKYLDRLYAFYSGSAPSTPDSLGYSQFTSTWENLKIQDFEAITDVANIEGNVFLSSKESGIYNVETQSLETLPGSTHTITQMETLGPSLFAVNSGSDNPLLVRSQADWATISSNMLGTNNPASLAISAGGVLWMKNEDNLGEVIVYNPQEQQTLTFRGQSDGIPSANVNDIVVDRIDEIWIATDRGPTVFADGTFLLSSDRGFLPFFENQPLLENEAIMAMAIDGGNRKWVGTKNGLWVFSENINTVDRRFTSSNSPLLSDVILDLAYDPTSGEMFVLTASGLCSYRSGSSEGRPFHTDVEIFPNPVTPNFSGYVTISGLAENANIKITDINGALVSEVDAVGGTATWDLTNLSNSPVVGGVYIILSSSFDGEETFVGKVAVVK